MCCNISYAEKNVEEKQLMLENGIKLLNIHYTKGTIPEMVYISYSFNFTEQHELYSYPFSLTMTFPQTQISTLNEKKKSPQLKPSILYAFHQDATHDYTSAFDITASTIHIVPLLQHPNDSTSTQTQTIRFAYGLEEGILNRDYYEQSPTYNKTRYLSIALPLSTFNFNTIPSLPLQYHLDFVFEMSPATPQPSQQQVSLMYSNDLDKQSTSIQKIMKIGTIDENNSSTIQSTTQEQSNIQQPQQQLFELEEEQQPQPLFEEPQQFTPITSTNLIHDWPQSSLQAVQTKSKDKLTFHVQFKVQKQRRLTEIYSRMDINFGYLGIMPSYSPGECTVYDWGRRCEKVRRWNHQKKRTETVTQCRKYKEYDYSWSFKILQHTPFTTIYNLTTSEYTIPYTKHFDCSRIIVKVLSPIIMDWRHDIMNRGDDSTSLFHYDTANLPLSTSLSTPLTFSTSSLSIPYTTKQIQLLQKAYHRTWDYLQSQHNTFPSYRTLMLYTPNGTLISTHAQKLPIETYLQSLKPSPLPLILGLTIPFSIIFIIILIVIIAKFKICKRLSECQCRKGSTTTTTLNDDIDEYESQQIALLSNNNDDNDNDRILDQYQPPIILPIPPTPLPSIASSTTTTSQLYPVMTLKPIETPSASTLPLENGYKSHGDMPPQYFPSTNTSNNNNNQSTQYDHAENQLYHESHGYNPYVTGNTQDQPYIELPSLSNAKPRFGDDDDDDDDDDRNLG